MDDNDNDNDDVFENENAAAVEGDGESVEDRDEEEDEESDPEDWDEDLYTRRKRDVLPRVQEAWTEFLEDTDCQLKLNEMEFTSHFAFTFLEGLLRHEARKPSPKPIRQLQMADNYFLDQEAFDSFLRFLQQIHPDELKGIGLSYNEFGPEFGSLSPRQVRSFLLMALRFRSLEHLSLGGNMRLFGQRIGQSLRDIIRGLPKLELHSCEIDSTTMQGICAGLAHPCCEVRHLSVEFLQLSGEEFLGFSDKEFRRFLNALKSHQGFQKLSLNGSGISDSRLEQLVEALNATETGIMCSALGLGTNNLTCRSLPLLNGILNGWPSLREITLWSTEILKNADPSDTDFLDFTEALRNNTRLQVLRLDSHSMSDEQVSALLQTLEINTTLQTLYLGGGRDIVEPVIQNLPRIKGLHSFIFDEMSKINLGSDRLKHALFQNTSLIKLARRSDKTPLRSFSHIFQRNKLIRRCNHFLSNDHCLNPRNLPFCLDRLMSNNCPNPSALFKFLATPVASIIIAGANITTTRKGKRKQQRGDRPGVPRRNPVRSRRNPVRSRVKEYRVGVYVYYPSHRGNRRYL